MATTHRLLLALFLIAPGLLVAHPIPEFPIRSSFEEGGAAIIKAEVDPRLWAAEPEKIPYLFNHELEKMTQSQRDELITKAKAYAAENVRFYFLPLGQVVPEFTWQITSEVEVPLTKPDQPVMVTGTWKTTIPSGTGGYQVVAADTCKVGVYIHNSLRRKPLERLNVLFPGEKSYILDLSDLRGSSAPLAGAVNAQTKGGLRATFSNLIKEGFLHVLPLGLDHILFVLGLFLLSRELKPLLLQVTTFTVAHTITLGLATLQIVHVSSSVVEPIIAGSIAVVALENIFHAKYSNWRLLIVFFFGLIHGLGFAGALSDLEIPEPLLVPGLLGFNLGVEFGQLAVISCALALTFWMKKDNIYRKYIVIPGSLAIAAMGLYWMIERIWG